MAHLLHDASPGVWPPGSLPPSAFNHGGRTLIQGRSSGDPRLVLAAFSQKLWPPKVTRTWKKRFAGCTSSTVNIAEKSILHSSRRTGRLAGSSITLVHARGCQPEEPGVQHPEPSRFCGPVMTKRSPRLGGTHAAMGLRERDMTDAAALRGGPGVWPPVSPAGSCLIEISDVRRRR